MEIPPLPHSWSELTWQQLCDMWQVKLRYGVNADVARAAAFIKLLQTPSPLPRNVEGRTDGAKGWRVDRLGDDPLTGESRYLISPLHKASLPLRGGLEGSVRWVITARELAYYAKQTIPWFDFPYGDPGKPAVKDDKGKVVEEAVDPVRGYVSPMRDSMVLPEEHIKTPPNLPVMGGFLKRLIYGGRQFAPLHYGRGWGWVCFQLPQAACSNLTWEQYRALQNITPQLFAEDNTDEQTIELQAQFLAHILTPRSFALFDTAGGNIKVRPHYVYEYNSERAERLVEFWRRTLSKDPSKSPRNGRLLPSITGKSTGRRAMLGNGVGGGSVLFHLCFQVYQTALSYYAAVYPLLFEGGGKQDPLKDALTGEVGTINTVMKYAGYASQQEVYDSNLPFILDILNTMTKEAKEIEKMNAKIKKK